MLPCSHKQHTHNLLQHDEEAEPLLVGHGGEGVVRVHAVDVGDEGRELGVVLEGGDALLQVGPADAVVNAEGRGVCVCEGRVEGWDGERENILPACVRDHKHTDTHTHVDTMGR